jgi:hypothetical protein
MGKSRNRSNAGKKEAAKRNLSTVEHSERVKKGIADGKGTCYCVAAGSPCLTVPRLAEAQRVAAAVNQGWCAVCCNGETRSQIRLPCSHRFHIDCLRQSVGVTDCGVSAALSCPVCVTTDATPNTTMTTPSHDIKHEQLTHSKGDSSAIQVSCTTVIKTASYRADSHRWCTRP